MSTFLSTYGLLEQCKSEVASLLRFNLCIHAFVERFEARNICPWATFISVAPKYVMTGLCIWRQVATEAYIVLPQSTWKSSSSTVCNNNDDLILFFQNVCLRGERAFNFHDPEDTDEEEEQSEYLQNIPPDQRTWDTIYMKEIV